jgi:pimeloyl-ACP methyl ester carboxylesterase
MRRILVSVLVVLAVLLAINTIVTDNETKDAEASIGRIVDFPGGDLHVREDGTPGGPAIVMLHGVAASMNWWQPTTELLDRYRLIRIDLLGHGGSEKPDDGYSMENQAKLVALALSRLNVEHAVIAGHSMGGIVATALVQLDPSLVDGVVVVGTPPNEDAGELPFLARLGFVPVVGEAIRRVVPDSVIKDNLEDAFADPVEVPDAFVDDFNRMTYTSYDSSHDESGDFNEERPVADRLAQAGKPLLVVFGAEDELVEPSSASDYQKVRGARIVTLPATGHSPMYEKPAETARLIAAFTDRVERGPSNRPPREEK